MSVTEEKVKKLEERVERIEKALLKLGEWINAQTEISESDTILFNEIDERLKKLEKGI